MPCYRSGGCGPYEYCSCSDCPASKPSYLERNKPEPIPVTVTETPLTLNELKQMTGEPVWVQVVDHTVFADKNDDFDGWGLVRKSWVRIWDERRADLIHIDYDFEDYGKEWLAYRHKPTSASSPSQKEAQQLPAPIERSSRAMYILICCNERNIEHPVVYPDKLSAQKAMATEIASTFDDDLDVDEVLNAILKAQSINEEVGLDDADVTVTSTSAYGEAHHDNLDWAIFEIEVPGTIDRTLKVTERDADGCGTNVSSYIQASRVMTAPELVDLRKHLDRARVEAANGHPDTDDDIVQTAINQFNSDKESANDDLRLCETDQPFCCEIMF